MSVVVLDVVLELVPEDGLVELEDQLELSVPVQSDVEADDQCDEGVQEVVLELVVLSSKVSVHVDTGVFVDEKEDSVVGER
jgi:hypothetical protein